MNSRLTPHALKHLPLLLASPQQIDKLSLRDEPLFVPDGRS